MNKIAIITDSSAFLPPTVIQRYGIEVVPLTIFFGKEAFLDGIEIEPPEFYRRLQEGPHHPTTTQPNPEDFLVVYEKLAATHDGIVVLLISSELSGTVSSACIAADQFDRVPVRVIDSRSTSMGLGLAVLAAARAASDGKTLDEVEQAARTVCDNIKVLFVVDTLEFLHKGGRIGGASRFLGTALCLKPLLHLNEGRVDALEKIRTKRKAVDRMLELAGEYANGNPVRVSVIHAGVSDEAEALKTTIENRFQCLEIYVTDLSPVIATHTGPGALGLAIYPENGASQIL
jgi:DegV family protein with EDD domain